MPKANTQNVSIDYIRHSEYYGLQEKFDELYMQSKNGETFNDIAKICFSTENILLAYRNIKTNSGSHTQGTDGLTIKDIAKMTPQEVVTQVHKIVYGKGYYPRLVRRKSIPKPNGKSRPLGIPCIWDRLIQQCVKQVIEPICEARFHPHSYGFRPNRSVEHAIAKCYNYLQLSKLPYVIEFDIKGFFDNVNHSKLIKQLWSLGIHDKHLLYLIRQMLKAPILLENGEIMYPKAGTPQGGIISPLLANIYLNELDQWISSQWQTNPVAYKYYVGKCNSGADRLSNGYSKMRKTNLKEMFIVRYADDFRIFCRNKEDAKATLIAVTDWLQKRLKLEISPEKTKIINARKKYMSFLGFKMKVVKKTNKFGVTSHIDDKALKRCSDKIKEQAKRIARPRNGYNRNKEIYLYNKMVIGMHNYYANATEITSDFHILQWEIRKILYNRLSNGRQKCMVKKGRELTVFEKKTYGKSKQLNYESSTGEPIYPVGYIRHRHAIPLSQDKTPYSETGRAKIHKNLSTDVQMQLNYIRNIAYGNNIEFEDNKLSLFSAQNGKCAVTGKDLIGTDFKMHCHHKKPKEVGGKDNYDNLILIIEYIHILIHCTNENTIKEYINKYKVNQDEIGKINRYRKFLNNQEIKL